MSRTKGGPMKAHRVVRVLGAALALGWLVSGCGGGGEGGSNKVEIDGEANFPVDNGGQPVSASPFVVIDPDRPNDPLLSDETTGDGRYFGIIRKTVSVAVIITGTVNGKDIRVSG